MKSKNQFSKYANEYKSNNIIQQICAKSLVREIKSNPKTILELGCGSGQIFSNISWGFDKYLAIDASKDMCELHPKSKNLEVKCFDFDSEEFFNEINKYKFDMVLSSSALQWSSNLSKIVENLSYITKEINAVLFTSNTFKTIQNITRHCLVTLTITSFKFLLAQRQSMTLITSHRSGKHQVVQILRRSFRIGIMNFTNKKNT